MSSGSSGRYQSKFFNFVNQQSRRLTQQWESTYRHLQVTTKWNLSALLSPLYLFWQSTDSSVKQLDTKEPPTRNKLQPHHPDLSSTTPLTTDRPIQRVLETVQNLPSKATTARFLQPLGFLWSKFFHSPITKDNSTQFLTIPNKPLVRGIATDLVNRQLVLVSAENQILDILTSQQQAKVTKRIIQEVASYGQLIASQQQKQLLPEINRILARLTDDNTQEIPVFSQGIRENFLNPVRIVAILDAAIAQLEQAAILPTQQRSQDIIQITQAQINIFLYGTKQLNPRGEILANTQNIEPQKLNISTLIAAALNYFFSISKQQKIESNFSEQKLPYSTYFLQDEYLTANPWLDWYDLYGESDNIAEKITRPSSTIKSRIAHQKKLTVPQPKVESSLTQKKPPTRNLKQAHQKFSRVIGAKHNSYQAPTAEAKPDWIETTATLLGYEKHILEQVLEWLDHVMLWLEQILVNTFSFFQGLLRGK